MGFSRSLVKLLVEVLSKTQTPSTLNTVIYRASERLVLLLDLVDFTVQFSRSVSRNEKEKSPTVIQ